MAYAPITSPSSLTLTRVKERLTTWRQNKRSRSEKIPEYLWDMIISLLQENTGIESKIFADLGITRAQVEQEKQRRESIPSSTEYKPKSSDEVEFCEVTPKSKDPSYPLAYKPAETFSTTTSVVEFYRKDGALMKIHICTEQFDELLNAFFNGGQ